MLYVKSVAATDYKVQGDEGKAELTCAEAAAVTEYTDVLTADMFAAVYQNNKIEYKDFSGVSCSGGSAAVYAGSSAKNGVGAIQLNNSGNRGIITTTSGGKVKKITIKFSSGSKQLDVYGKSTAYTATSDLYATVNTTATQGIKIGSLNADGTIEVTGDYEYIGLRPNKGAIYITSITIVWEK